MDYDLLYKILAIGFFILGPVLPAFLLYLIAPEEKIWAKGDFAGFQINATGATAIFIVLFASLYPKIDNVIKSIDKYEGNEKIINNLITQNKHCVDSLTSNQPWKVDYTIQLTDGTNAVDEKDYVTYVNVNSLTTDPDPRLYNSMTHTFTFYIPQDAFEHGPINADITLKNGYVAKSFKIDKNDKVHTDNGKKSISLPLSIKKGDVTNYSGLKRTFNINTGSISIPQNP